MSSARSRAPGSSRWTSSSGGSASWTRSGRSPLDCHHGLRSAAVVQWLRRQDIPALNLRGGIDAWAAEVDPAFSRY